MPALLEPGDELPDLVLPAAPGLRRIDMKGRHRPGTTGTTGTQGTQGTPGTWNVLTRVNFFNRSPIRRAR
jgi:hypothetical protein